MITFDDFEGYEVNNYEKLIKDLSDIGIKNEIILEQCKRFVEHQTSSEPCELILIISKYFN
ncbi:hypothetical protein DSECCO2_579350 [anaerobic digester metagenome]